jgi:hypothetical protein
MKRLEVFRFELKFMDGQIVFKDREMENMLIVRLNNGCLWNSFYVLLGFQQKLTLHGSSGKNQNDRRNQDLR